MPNLELFELEGRINAPEFESEMERFEQEGQIDASAWSALGQAVSRNKSLRTLLINVHGLPRQCTQPFVKSLAEGTTLREVSLAGFPIGANTARLIKSWLGGRSTVLRKLAIHVEHIESGVLVRLSEALKQSALRVLTE